MQIEETFIEDTFFMDVDEPYTKSLEFMDFCSCYGVIKEIENDVMTDGPHKRTNLVFHIMKGFDAFSSARLVVTIEGSQKFGRAGSLRMHIKGAFILAMAQAGIFSDALQRFYMEHIHKMMRRNTEEYIRFVHSEMQGYVTAAQRL